MSVHIFIKNSMSYENFHLPNGFRASPFNYQRKQASAVKFNEIYFDLKVIKIDNLILHYLASILVKFEEKLSIFLFQNIYLIFVDYGKILSGSPGKRNPLLKVKWSFPNDFMPD
jgi:hypothetical protein